MRRVVGDVYGRRNYGVAPCRVPVVAEPPNGGKQGSSVPVWACVFRE